MAAEKLFKDKLQRYKARLRKCEDLLLTHGIRPGRSSQQRPPADFQPDSSLDASSPVLKTFEVLLSFLNVGDWMMRFVRLVVAALVPAPIPGNPDSARHRKRKRDPVGMSAYSPSTSKRNADSVILDVDELYSSQRSLGL